MRLPEAFIAAALDVLAFDEPDAWWTWDEPYAARDQGATLLDARVALGTYGPERLHVARGV